MSDWLTVRAIYSDMDKQIKCPECGEPLECMYAIGSKESYDGRARRLYHCFKCLSNWSESLDENTGETRFERYFFG